MKIELSNNLVVDPLIDSQIKTAVLCLQKGGVIAYPTEAVYGLGCAPLNEAAVMRILTLKSRPVHKGLILLSDNFEHVLPYVDLTTVSDKQLNSVLQTWPGPYTWLFPASNKVPYWIKGDFESVAIRVTAHPIAAQLCRLFQEPIVSTSANISGYPPARTSQEVMTQFEQNIDSIVSGAVDLSRGPSEIKDVLTGAIIRA